jgi:hypothetical protein
MQRFKLDILLSDDERRNVALMITDGVSIGEVAKHVRRGGHRVVARDVRKWAAVNVLNAPAHVPAELLLDSHRQRDKSVEYAQYLRAIETMHDFCEAREESFRTCMRKAIEMWIGWHSTDSHRRDAETQR